MPEPLGTPPSLEDVTEALRRVEQRLAALEAWHLRTEGRSTASSTVPQEAAPVASRVEEAPADFDLALTGRTLIILGGAFLLRAATEGGALPIAVGVALGLVYALFWALLSLRKSVSSGSAIYYAIATTLTSLPLIFEATRKFNVFTAWSSALALGIVAAVMFVLIWRRRLHAVAWMFTLMTVSILPLLMVQTRSVVPFALVLLALGIVTLWLGYQFEWTLLPWFAAIALDILLLVITALAVNEGMPALAPSMAIGVHCLAFAAYLASFSVRALGGHRDATEIDIAQTFTLLFVALGGAMWIATSRIAFAMPLVVAMLALGAISYAVSFTFVARQFTSPRNFVFTSSLALMLVVLSGAFITHGFANTIFWTVLALSSAYFATHYRKSSLALHAAVYLFSGFIGGDVFRLGVHALLLKQDQGWLVPGAGAIVLFIACVLAATIRPIERQGSFELWTAAKVMILVELGWIAATLIVSAAGLLFLQSVPTDPATVAILRTAVMAALTVATAWASRFATLSPSRLLVNPLMIILGMKLLWEDVRVGRPATLFISFAIVGAALSITPRFRRKATLPQPVLVGLEEDPFAPAPIRSDASEPVRQSTRLPGHPSEGR